MLWAVPVFASSATVAEEMEGRKAAAAAGTDTITKTVSDAIRQIHVFHPQGTDNGGLLHVRVPSSLIDCAFGKLMTPSTTKWRHTW